jgi:hypothetical protein
MNTVITTSAAPPRPHRTRLLLIVASGLSILATLASGPIAFGIYMANDFDDESPSNTGNVYLWILGIVLLAAAGGVVVGWTLHGLRKFSFLASFAGIASACAGGAIVLFFAAEMASIAI